MFGNVGLTIHKIYGLSLRDQQRDQQRKIRENTGVHRFDQWKSVFLENFVKRNANLNKFSTIFSILLLSFITLNMYFASAAKFTSEKGVQYVIYVNDVFLIFLLLTLHRFQIFFDCSYCWIWIGKCLLGTGMCWGSCQLTYFPS